jgi:hypothetical protein
VLRSYFLENPNYRDLLPSWMRTCRNGQQFWQYIKEMLNRPGNRGGCLV